MLYMFQAVSPPIIRSSKLYTQYLVYVKLACWDGVAILFLVAYGHHYGI
jgi:hypothetical protein